VEATLHLPVAISSQQELSTRLRADAPASLNRNRWESVTVPQTYQAPVGDFFPSLPIENAQMTGSDSTRLLLKDRDVHKLWLS